MEKKLIKKEYRYCPVCDKEHEVKIFERESYTVVKSRQVKYIETYFVCENVDNDNKEYVNASMMNENLRRARNEYRKLCGLLLPEEIVNIRGKYGLSQVDLARILGWGDVTITRYETKAIQDQTYDNILRDIKDNPKKLLEYYNQNIERLDSRKREAIESNINKYIKAEHNCVLERYYMDYMSPSAANGYVTLNEDKVVAIVWYLAKNISNLYKIKLAKLLWYIDMLSFKYHKKGITGMVYLHKQMGALPVGDVALLTLDHISVEEEPCEASFEDIRYHFIPLDEPNLDVLSIQEVDIINEVIKKFKEYSTKEIVEYMHKERVYINTSMNEMLLFTKENCIANF